MQEVYEGFRFNFGVGLWGVVVVQLPSPSDVPYGCLTQTAPALLLSAETLLIFADIRTITM